MSISIHLSNSTIIIYERTGMNDILIAISQQEISEDIDKWMQFCFFELDAPLQLFIALASTAPEYQMSPADKAAAEEKGKKDITNALGELELHLSERTFVCSENVTLADISLYCTIHPLLKHGITSKSKFPSVFRWFMTCAYHRNLSGVLKSCSLFPGEDDPDAITSFGNGKWGRGRLRVKDLLLKGKDAIGSEVVMKGWIRTSRSGEKGAVLFVELTDGSSVKGVQLVLTMASTVGSDAVSKCGGAGASLSIVGKVVEGLGKAPIEVQVTKAVVLGCVYGGDKGEIGGKNYPMAKKAHSLEYLREQAHLRPRSKVFSSAMRVRHALAYATHKFFNERGFVYVHTPLITGADCEGAGEQFTVTTLLPEKGKMEKGIDKNGNIDFTQDFFGRRCGLTVSGQLNVETHACALTDVYTFGPTFRAENSHTTRHLAEFWMIEPEICFAELVDDMALAEDYVKFCTKYVMEHNADDLNYFENEYPAGEKGLKKRLQNVLNNDFAQITYTAAIELLQRDIASGKKTFENYPSWGDDLGSEHERYLCEVIYAKPTIVINYPKGIKSFYMKLNDDNETVAAMDILVPKIGELIGGSAREDDLEVLERRMKEGGLNPADLWWYNDMRKYGTVPHAGFGLGFERLIMFVTGLENIRDVIPFPRVPGHADF